MDRWFVSAGSLTALALVAACATGNDSPAATDSATDTATSTSTSTSTSSTSDDSDDSSDVTSTTNDSSDSTTTTGDASSGSTGCTDGEEGCACRADDPQCDDNLECIMDVCTAGLCETEDDEPNDDAPDEFVDLGNYNDNEPAQMVMSQLSGPDDVDWLQYSCTDVLGSEVDPTLIIDQNTPMRVCIFLDCDNGGNPTDFCEGGAMQVDGPFDFLEGCCVTDGSTIDVANYNCPDSSNDSITAWIRVDMAETMQCEPYTLTYNC